MALIGFPVYASAKPNPPRQDRSGLLATQANDERPPASRIWLGGCGDRHTHL